MLILGKSGPTPFQKHLVTTSGLFLLSYAILNKSFYFSSLELVVFIGALLAYFDNRESLKKLSILTTGSVALVFLLANGQLSTSAQALGALGLILVAAGYATTRALYMCIGAIFITIYAAFRWVETAAAVDGIFCILNFVFIFPSGWVAIMELRRHYPKAL